MVFFSSRPFPNILKYRITHEIFQRSGKQDSFRHILKSSASIYESSGSQFFRITTGIQSGPDPSDEPRFIMTFLTILGVMEISYSFRMKGKQVKRYQSHQDRVLRKVLANNFALLDAGDNISRLLNRGGTVDLPLLRTLLAICQKSWKPSFWEVIDSFV